MVPVIARMHTSKVPEENCLSEVFKDKKDRLKSYWFVCTLMTGRGRDYAFAFYRCIYPAFTVNYDPL